MITSPTRPRQELPRAHAEYLSKLLETDNVLFNAMLAAYHGRGWSNPALGAALGMNPPAVSKRIERAEKRPADPVIDAAVRAADIPRPPRVNATLDDRRLPPEKIQALKRMQLASSRVNGATPIDHPDRRAAERFAAELYRLITKEGFTAYYLAKALGLSHRAVTSRLERHGYRDACPSVANTPSGTYHNRRIGDASEDEKKIEPEKVAELCRAWDIWENEARRDPLREVVDDLVLAGHTLASIAAHLPRVTSKNRGSKSRAALADLTAAL